MSWEYSKYEAKCENCGKNGFCIQGADDWNRSSTNWLGFINMAPSVTEVARKRADSLDSRPVCGCGKGTIVVGKFLGECDSSGNWTRSIDEIDAEIDGVRLD